MTCPDCGTIHSPGAHSSPDAMEAEAARATERGDGLAAAIWRARAASWRNGKILRRKVPRCEGWACRWERGADGRV